MSEITTAEAGLQYQNPVTEAFEAAKQKFDSLPIVCGILDISNSYAYMSMKKGEISLPCALKLEVMLDGKFTWRDLCPRMKDEVDSIKERLSAS